MRTLLILCLLLLPALAYAESFCTAPFFPRASSYVVVDDGNNLRQWGGDNYANAPVLRVLNTGDEVRILSQDGKWAFVETPDGLQGYMSTNYLASYESFARARTSPGGDMEFLGCNQDQESRQVDLDGDGRMETVRLTCEPGLWCSNSFMDVLAPDGSLLFEGPRHGDSPFIFCDCHMGVYQPDVFIDLDQDGSAELITAHPQSDVSPAIFDMYSWTGYNFVPMLTTFTLTADRNEPDTYKMGPAFMAFSMPYRFIYFLREYSGQELIAGVYTDEWEWGEAIVRFDGRAFQLVRWAKPLQK